MPARPFYAAAFSCKSAAGPVSNPRGRLSVKQMLAAPGGDVEDEEVDGEKARSTSTFFTRGCNLHREAIKATRGSSDCCVFHEFITHKRCK